MKTMGLISILASLLVIFSVHAQEIPMDETGFTKYVAERMQGEVGDTKVTIKEALTLGVGDLQANLDRIYGFCQNNEDGCEREVSSYVKNLTQFMRAQNAPPTKEAVRLVVRTSVYVKHAQALIQQGTSEIQPRPLVKGLEIVPVLDLPTAIRMLTLKDNASLGLTAEEVYNLGISNLQKELKPIMDVAAVAGHGQIGHLLGNPYDPSRLALHDSWAALAKAQDGNLIIAIPATDAVFYIGENTPVAIDALRALVINVIRRAPNPLSDTLLRWTPSGWEVVE